MLKEGKSLDEIKAAVGDGPTGPMARFVNAERAISIRS
jgi:hypothetical protein